MMTLKNLPKIVFIGAALALGALQPAMAEFDMKAGPILHDNEAKIKCESACSLKFNGNWVTTVEGKMSICSGTNTAADGKNYIIMDATGGLEAGPIWNNGEAKAKCDSAFDKVEWNGHWRTTEQNVMSTCTCTGTAVNWTPNVIEQ